MPAGYAGAGLAWGRREARGQPAHVLQVQDGALRRAVHVAALVLDGAEGDPPLRHGGGSLKGARSLWAGPDI